MSDPAPQPVNVPVTLSTVPLEIFRHITSYLEYDETMFSLRLVCRVLYYRMMDKMELWFSHVSTSFSRRELHHSLKGAEFPILRTSAKIGGMSMTFAGWELASPLRRGWERDELGYLVNPEKIYRICALKDIFTKLVNIKTFRLEYIVDYDYKGNEKEKASLQRTIGSILAICAAIQARVKGIRIPGDYTYFAYIDIDPAQGHEQWDKSIPLLDAMCGNLQALEINFENDMADLEWIEMLLTKCQTLEQLSLKFYDSMTSLHPFIRHISATSVNPPPVQSLFLEGGIFTQDELVGLVGRFKNTLRSIELVNITISEGTERAGWTSFIDWLQKITPNLEKFTFQALQYSSHHVVCFDSIFNDPQLSFKRLIRAPWESYARLPSGNGALVFGIPDFYEIDTSVYFDIDVFFTKLGRGVYGLDSKPCKNSLVYTVGFEGSKVGAKEALGLLLGAAAVEKVDTSLETNSTSIKVGWEFS
ncbi:hypothetical protein V495_06327 [Pseudogymnoascus sp. VKM F-4514 (FW-929)]|nr:hypothetical protein V495_06327 [Pseudogymnoascus sp. VKM F-4514 (FW-929)]KFY56332.1 hypothetical protein V497_06403 [Pseudogymnoascus sp. VKM F-4516 (FW-969)]